MLLSRIDTVFLYAENLKSDRDISSEFLHINRGCNEQ